MQKNTTILKNTVQKNELSRTLKMYSAIASSVIAASQSAKAGIVYTDVNPDDTVNIGEQYMLDLNNDNVPDFKIWVETSITSSTQYTIAAIGAFSNNKINFTQLTTSSVYGPVVHDKGDTINNNMAWGGSYGCLMGYLASNATYYYNIGDWPGLTNKYAALKIVVGSNNYFGWVRLEMASDYSSVTIKDYAYNDTPDQSILAGEGQTASIKEITLNNVSAYSFQNKININFLNGQLPKGTIEVTNTLGQKVFSSTINEANSIITIDEPSGNFYIVSVQTEKGLFTKKVFLQNK